jgi:uncharacterized protein (DUF2062 family)
MKFVESLVPHTIAGFIMGLLFVLAMYQFLAFVWQDYQTRKRIKRREQQARRRS